MKVHGSRRNEPEAVDLGTIFIFSGFFFLNKMSLSPVLVCRWTVKKKENPVRSYRWFCEERRPRLSFWGSDYGLPMRNVLNRTRISGTATQRPSCNAAECETPARILLHQKDRKDSALCVGRPWCFHHHHKLCVSCLKLLLSTYFKALVNIAPIIPLNDCPIYLCVLFFHGVCTEKCQNSQCLEFEHVPIKDCSKQLIILYIYFWSTKIFLFLLGRWEDGVFGQQ